MMNRPPTRPPSQRVDREALKLFRYVHIHIHRLYPTEGNAAPLLYQTGNPKNPRLYQTSRRTRPTDGRAPAAPPDTDVSQTQYRRAPTENPSQKTGSKTTTPTVTKIGMFI
jgi:hypothetical protein